MKEEQSIEKLSAEIESLTTALLIANKELIFQSKEKAKRASELLIANEELAYQNEEKAKRASELVIANDEKVARAIELQVSNDALIIANEKLKISIFETITLARIMCELRDPYTSSHEETVGKLSSAIAEQMGFDKDFQEGICIAGYLHDVGKIVIPAEILSKPTKLSFEEFALIKNHVIVGYNAIKDINFPWDISKSVLEHHERVDGSGYPNGLKGEDISIGGKILAVADVIDAMSSHRPYRASLGLNIALDEIKRGAGILYDQDVVNACLKLYH